MANIDIIGLIPMSWVNVPAKTNGMLVGHTETHAIGGGEWSIEVFDEDGCFLEEFVGSNGTRDQADDLWSRFDEWCNKIIRPAYMYRQYKSPDGMLGSYSYFRNQVEKGHLHGLIVKC